MKFNIIEQPLVRRKTFDVKRLPTHSLASINLFEPSLVSESLTRQLCDSNQERINCICSDIDLIIRLTQGKKLDPTLAEELLSRIDSSSVSDEVSEILDQMSDEEIIEGVRSKYIQTPAQLEEYVRSLDSRLESLSSQELSEAIENSDVVDSSPASPADNE